MLKINRGSIGAAGDAITSTLSHLTYFWPFSWRSVSALILGALLAKWFWILFAPNAIYTAAATDRSEDMEAGRLFGLTQTAESSAIGVALPNVQLLGVFAPSAGKQGFAILKLNNNGQIGVAAGNEVAPGTKLSEVHADYVVLERSGLMQRVSLDSKAPIAGSKHPAIAYSEKRMPKASLRPAREQISNGIKSSHPEHPNSDATTMTIATPENTQHDVFVDKNTSARITDAENSNTGSTNNTPASTIKPVMINQRRD